MRKGPKTVQRVGQIYRFMVNGTEYAAFVWQAGALFRGRVEGQAAIPIAEARTSIAVRNALQQSLTSHLST